MSESRRLIILRHAKSSWDNPADSDHQRPLNARGRKVAPQMADYLQQQGLVPQLVYCSSALRARETVDLLLANWAEPPTVELRANLYLAPPATYFELLGQVDGAIERIMLVGHNPGLETIAHNLMQRPESVPTAAVTVLQANGGWSEIATRPQVIDCRVIRPKEVLSS